jgi:hypothetical protein
MRIACVIGFILELSTPMLPFPKCGMARMECYIIASFFISWKGKMKRFFKKLFAMYVLKIEKYRFTLFTKWVTALDI